MVVVVVVVGGIGDSDDDGGGDVGVDADCGSGGSDGDCVGNQDDLNVMLLKWSVI